MLREEGFDEQRRHVMPRPLVDVALQQAFTRRLLVTDAGYYPVARDHACTRPHGADESILILCLNGIGWLKTGRAEPGRANETIAVGPSRCIFIPAHVAHAYGSSPTHPWTIWWCHVRGTNMNDIAEMLGSERQCTVFPVRAVDRVVSLFDQIVTHMGKGPTPAHQIAAAGLAHHLFATVTVDRVLPAAGTPLERALRYLNERIEAHVRVSELAGLVGLSPSHLTALFHKATGSGVVAYHIKLKMGQARTLLDTTSMSVSEIGRAVGYDDALYFSRQFSKAHGLSPSAYRGVQKG